VGGPAAELVGRGAASDCPRELEPGAVMEALADRHGVSTGQLYTWRKHMLAAVGFPRFRGHCYAADAAGWNAAAICSGVR
jgi:hypothetical protein